MELLLREGMSWKEYGGDGPGLRGKKDKRPKGTPRKPSIPRHDVLWQDVMQASRGRMLLVLMASLDTKGCRRGEPKLTGHEDRGQQGVEKFRGCCKRGCMSWWRGICGHLLGVWF